jgi:nucleotide-binding universal stress UspA family protein
MAFTPYATILLPFDGSDPSIHAARHVAAHAKASRVLVLNVQEAIVAGPDGATAAHATHQERLLTAERILREAERILAAGDMLIGRQVAFGEPAECICRAARERACSIIVLGARARDSLEAFSSGSIASRVVRESPVPVLLVRGGRGDVMHLPVYAASWIGA